MTPTTVTDALIHKLVTGTHAEGITAIDVAAAVEDRGRVLLVSGTDNNFETHWDLPAAPVLPGESLLDAICHSLTILGLHVAQVTNYLGHHDHDQADNLTRVFCFAVNVTDPGPSATQPPPATTGPISTTCPASPQRHGASSRRPGHRRPDPRTNRSSGHCAPALPASTLSKPAWNCSSTTPSG
jgi:ADP-ribose pyrophosphatase YjhB (NUDIX family)